MSAALPPGLLVGVDGGASAVRAVVVEAGTTGLRAGPGARREHARCAAADAHAPASPEERAAAEAWIEDTAACVGEVLERAHARRALLGVCMPGLKTPDGRGIEWARHGPRVPALLDRVEARLGELGVELVAPAAGLYSDGDCCAAGEEHAADGAFAGVRTAWYAGGGTGLAEGLKLDGRLVAMDAVAGWLPKAWRLPWRAGASLEDALSARGLNARCGGRVEERVERDAAARDAVLEAVDALAGLAEGRRAALRAHAGLELERVVVGQRLGRMLADARLEFARAALAGALAARGLPDGGWLVLSPRLEAPALGAAALALEAWRRGRG